MSSKSLTKDQRETVSRIVLGVMAILQFIYRILLFISLIKTQPDYAILPQDIIVLIAAGATLYGGAMFLIRKDWGLIILIFSVILDFFMMIFFGELIHLITDIIIFVFSVQFIRYKQKEKEKQEKLEKLKQKKKLTKKDLQLDL